MKKLALGILSYVKPIGLVTALAMAKLAFSQQVVPVKDEPRHVPVLLNKYIRIIDARIEDGDTSLFHVHAIPSAFVFLTDLVYDNQPLGKPWSRALSKKGMAWYSGFEGGPSTHRVGVERGERLHAYDIEILSSYGFSRDNLWKPLYADTIFVSDRCAGYRLQLNTNTTEVKFSGRGPVVAVLVKGEEIEALQPVSKTFKKLKEEDYAYLKPDVQTTLKLTRGTKAEIVLFEIR